MSGSWWALSVCGFLFSSAGGLGGELLDRFAGRPLEAYCRLKRNRERFGAVLDHQDAAIRGSEYLRMIGTVMFLIAGTAAIFIREGRPPGFSLVYWAVAASGMIMMVQVWLPAAVTRFASTPVLYHTWPFWFALSTVMSPLAAPGLLVEWITRRLAGKEENADEDEEQLEDEIRTIVTAGTREGYFGPGVREMIQGVMTLHEDTVGHIMTPRSDVDAIDIAATWQEVLQIVVEAGRTRFPVYQETLDRVVGVLYVKDLLPFLAGRTLSEQSLEEIIRRPWTVPVDRSVELLLREFLHSRSHMAIVLDEFQQTAGVVTIEDALEEIVGEIVDESDEDEEYGIAVIDDQTVEVDGRVMVDDLNETANWDLPESDDYETVAGYVLYHAGLIPRDWRATDDRQYGDRDPQGQPSQNRIDADPTAQPPRPESRLAWFSRARPGEPSGSAAVGIRPLIVATLSHRYTASRASWCCPRSLSRSLHSEPREAARWSDRPLPPVVMHVENDCCFATDRVRQTLTPPTPAFIPFGTVYEHVLGIATNRHCEARLRRSGIGVARGRRIGRRAGDRHQSAPRPNRVGDAR